MNLDRFYRKVKKKTYLKLNLELKWHVVLLLVHVDKPTKVVKND